MDEAIAEDFRAECERIAREDQAKAARIRKRAGRLPLTSNHRRKLTAEALQLEEHAGLMLAAADKPAA